MQQPPPYPPPYPPQGQWSVSPPDQGPVPYQWTPPQYPQPPQMQPPPPKKSRKKLWLIIGAVIAVLVIGGIAAGASGGSTSSTPDTTSQATQPAQATQAVQPTQALAPTAVPTQAPTTSPAQVEQAYKASATDTTVANLDKDGNSDQGNIVHFTATILNFVKDDSGNTAGVNVDDPNTSGVIQVGFPGGTDLSQLNTGDSLEVWGQDMGTASGTNAFGATIQEVVVSAVYMTDQTTGYHAG